MATPLIVGQRAREAVRLPIPALSLWALSLWALSASGKHSSRTPLPSATPPSPASTPSPAQPGPPPLTHSSSDKDTHTHTHTHTHRCHPDTEAGTGGDTQGHATGSHSDKPGQELLHSWRNLRNQKREDTAAWASLGEDLGRRGSSYKRDPRGYGNRTSVDGHSQGCPKTWVGIPPLPLTL